MKLKELAGRADRLQSSARFKVVATILIIAVSAVSYSIWLAASAGSNARGETVIAQTQTPPTQTPKTQTPPTQTPQASAQVSAPRLTVGELRSRLRAGGAWVAVGVAVLAVATVAIIIVWLGLALTYLGLILVAAFIAAPLALYDPTRGLGRLLIGALALTASFSVLVQALRAALSADRPIVAIARNVLVEAMRMKIGIIFILVLIFLLAALPGLLDASQPLRYRIQSFLQYSTTGTFWVLALLTIFFSVSTVAFEQRDRVIWQTMVKPVAPLEYLLGKWVGVMTLNLALLSVSATGVFLFTEFLRDQPAKGELRPFVMLDGQPGLTEDRRLLETQVLTAQAGASVDPPRIDYNRVEEHVAQRLAEATQRDYSLRNDSRRRAQLEKDLRSEIVATAIQSYRAVPPGQQRTYRFSGLGSARRLDRPLTVRYKINAGSENPNTLYRLVFISQASIVKQQAPLSITQTFSLPPQAVGDDGAVELTIVNGDPSLGVVNPLTFSFPPDGLEVLYTAGSYEANFLRVAAVLWLKLGFIASVAIASSTFLSFPVACMLALLVLFAAESSSFLRASLDQYPLRNNQGNIDWVAVAMNLIARPIAAAFWTYGQMKPTANLVNGLLVAWSALAKGAVVISVWSISALGIGWAIFRKRELAIYSGQ